MKQKESEIYLAGGCFWGLEKYLGNQKGVKHTHECLLWTFSCNCT